MQEVSLLRQEAYSFEEILNKIEQAIDSLGGFDKHFSRKSSILLKPNVLGAFPAEKCVTTHPLFLKAVIRYFQAFGCTVSVGDSPAITGLKHSLKVCGLYAVCEETGAPVIAFKHSKEVNVPSGAPFRKLELAAEIEEYDYLVNLPKLKTHTMMTLTLAVKNLFGCVVGKRKAQWHFSAGRDYRAFASMLLEIAHVVKPAMNILDGVIGMQGDGPSSGYPYHAGLIAASSNPVAIDRAICQLLGFSDDFLPTNSVAIEQTANDESARLANEILYTILSPEDFRLPPFALPSTTSANFAPKGGSANSSVISKVKTELISMAIKGGEKLMTGKPVVNHNICTLCNMCKEICPPQVISEQNGKITINYEDCIRCYCCHEVCQEDAMEVQESFVKRYLGVLS